MSGIRFFSNMIRFGFAVSMATSDAAAVAGTAIPSFTTPSDHKGVIGTLAGIGAFLSFLNGLAFHGKVAQENFEDLRGRGRLVRNGHGHGHGDHHHDHEYAIFNSCGSSLVYGLKYTFASIVRIAQLMMSYCRFYIEVGTVISFAHNLIVNKEEELLPLSHSYAHAGMVAAYLFFTFPYDFLVTSEETFRLLCDKMHLHVRKDYLALFFLNTVCLPYKWFATWRNQIGYHIQILGHTAPHIAFVAELLEEFGCERDDILNPAIGLPMLAFLGVLLSSIYATTHFFEGQEHFRPNLHELANIQNQMPPLKEPSAGLKSTLLFPSNLFSGESRSSCIRHTLGSLSVALFAVALGHGGDALLPVMQTGELIGVDQVDSHKALLYVISSLVFAYVATTIFYAEGAVTAHKCKGLDAGAHLLLPGHSNSTATTAFYGAIAAEEPPSHSHHPDGSDEAQQHSYQTFF